MSGEPKAVDEAVDQNEPTAEVATKATLPADGGPTAEEKADVVDDASKLAQKMSKRIVMDSDGMPQRLQWRPHISIQAMVIGAVVDIAVELILQQLGFLLLDTRDLVEGIIQGSILGALAPMFGTMFGVLWVNTRIDRMRAEAA